MRGGAGAGARGDGVREGRGAGQREARGGRRSPDWDACPEVRAAPSPILLIPAGRGGLRPCVALCPFAHGRRGRARPPCGGLRLGAGGRSPGEPRRLAARSRRSHAQRPRRVLALGRDRLAALPGRRGQAPSCRRGRAARPVDGAGHRQVEGRRHWARDLAVVRVLHPHGASARVLRGHRRADGGPRVSAPGPSGAPRRPGGLLRARAARPHQQPPPGLLSVRRADARDDRGLHLRLGARRVPRLVSAVLRGVLRELRLCRAAAPPAHARPRRRSRSDGNRLLRGLRAQVRGDLGPQLLAHLCPGAGLRPGAREGETFRATRAARGLSGATRGVLASSAPRSLSWSEPDDADTRHHAWPISGG